MDSKKWFGLITVVAACAGGCSSAPVTDGQDPSSATKVDKQVAAIACTPITGSAPFLNCGAINATNVALAGQVQTQLTAQMGAIFANVSMVPDFTANQVVITSPAADFGTLFGQQIVAPLNTAGVFTAAIPFQVGSIAPGLGLVANIWGTVPVWNTPGWAGGAIAPIPPISPALATPFAALPGFAGVNTAFNTAAFTTSAANTATFTAATMPMSFWISTPLDASLGVACNGAFAMGCL